MTLYSFAAVILVFAGLIFFHELGHFLLARCFGIGVQTFSIGFGKKLFSFTRKKTQYCIALIPLGGYVSLVGESPSSVIPEPFTQRESFALRPAWQRFLVVSAGAVFNILLAVILYFVIFFFSGKSYLLPIIGTVQENSPAYSTQLQPGDTIVAINNIPVKQWEQIRTLTQLNGANKMSLIISRDNTFIQKDIIPQRSFINNIFGEREEVWVLGITPTQQTAKEYFSVFAALRQAVKTTYTYLHLTAVGVGKLITGKTSTDNITGPIMIIKTLKQQSENGIVALLALAAFISINLGFVNILPIPVLDGGHMVFLLYEMVCRKPIPLVLQTRLMQVGMVLLLCLMVFATYNDISRLFQ